MIVVSDTTPIISLLKADKLELLRMLYQNILIPDAVFAELLSNPRYGEEREQLKSCEFLVVGHVQNQESVRILRDITGLDIGESEALILYEEQKADMLLIDERKGRGIAKNRSVEYMGTIGMLMLAFDKKYLTGEEVQEMLVKMVNKGIRISPQLYSKVMKYVGMEK